MATKKKARKTTFRQRIRDQANTRLERLLSAAYNALDGVINDENAPTSVELISRILSSKETKSLRVRLVTDMADQYERELEALHDKQQTKLDLGDAGGTSEKD